MFAAAWLAGVAASACAPRPTLEVAPQVLSTEWRSAPSTDVAPSAGPETGLGQSLRSPTLARLTTRALAANPDIAIAATRLERARAELKIARAEMLPVISASAGASSARTKGDTASLSNFSGGVAQLAISFDVDLFGAGRAGRRAARDRAFATAFDKDAASLIVEAEVARAFVQYAALSDRILFLDRNIESGRELERIIKVRFREGAANRVDVGLQAIDVRQLETDRLRLVEARERTLHALAILCGEEAPRFELQEASLAGMAMPPLALPQPGEVLVRRPDVRAAEARIAAASGDVAQARAAFLPTLRFDASALGEGATLGGPIGSTIALGANLLAPIFDRGRLGGRLAATAASQHESVELYRRALLTAFGEVEDALAATEYSRGRTGLIDRMLEEARIAARLSRLQYLEGEADLRTVLDAERLLAQTEDARAISFQEQLVGAIDLYEAVGGTYSYPSLSRQIR